MGLRRRAGDDSPYHAREALAVAEPRLRPAHMSWSVTPGVRPAVTLAYSARHDCGGGRVAKPASSPPPPTPLPGAASWRPQRTVGRQVPGGAGERALGRGRRRPGRGRLCPASGSVDHRPCSRPPWLSTRGIARGGRRRRSHAGGAGEAARTAVSRGWRGVAMCPPPPRPHRGAAILAEGARELHRKRRTTNKRQSKVDERCLSTRGSQFRAPTTPPPKKDTICRWDWGEGVAGFDLAQKKKGLGMRLS